ncbi:MAG: threonine--tRNA ligase [Caldisericia bacterium]|nr:threonine--tRNA ligase [Caldisericia bacterium]MDD4614187.1 threonine--tRNA ligase [Caldisericia bacterium]
MSSENHSLEALRHSASHVLAQAVKRLYPEVKLGIGPSTDTGFYYDFDRDISFVPEDLERIQEEMEKIVKENIPIQRSELSRDDAKKQLEEQGETYKLELLQDIPDDETIGMYTQGEFTDMCKGPHLSSTGHVRYFQLLSLAGAYWRGKETNPMLQRIYGTAFFDKKELKHHLAMLEEAKKRDHRKVGKELKIFIFEEQVGAGFPIWLPKGASLLGMIEEYDKKKHIEAGYQEVRTPHLGLVDLWKTSGHYDHYLETMFPPMERDHQTFMVKPMNCPFHLTVYKSELRSYRELPIRYFELANVYRYEKSGVLHGLLRVRSFEQDDAHVFCTPDQLETELNSIRKFSIDLFKDFGFTDLQIFVSVRDQAHIDAGKYTGDPEQWDHIEKEFISIVERMGIPYQIDPGEAKFYGPAIDIKVKDALGRLWQCTTIQVDFNLPQKFGLTYVGEDGQEHVPYMLHTATLGSMERFIAILLEQYAGNLPLWISPEQARIIPISDDVIPYAQQVCAMLRKHNIRVIVDENNERMNAKVRKGEMEKVPYLLIVGKSEEEQQTVSVRKRHRNNLGTMSIEDIVKRILQDIEEKAIS